MTDLEAIKSKISDGKIHSYVESYLEISEQIDNFENELHQGSLKELDNNEILVMYDYLMEKITKYYIENYYMKETK